MDDTELAVAQDEVNREEANERAVVGDKVYGPTREDFENYKNRGVNTGQEFGPTREDFEANETYKKAQEEAKEYRSKERDEKIKEEEEEDKRIKKEEDEAYARAKKEQKEDEEEERARIKKARRQNEVNEDENIRHDQTMYKLKLQEREALSQINSKAKIARIQAQMKHENDVHAKRLKYGSTGAVTYGIPNSLSHESGQSFMGGSIPNIGLGVNIRNPRVGGNQHVGKTPRVGSFGNGGKLPRVGNMTLGKTPTIGLRPTPAKTSSTKLGKSPKVYMPTIGAGLGLSNTMPMISFGGKNKKSGSSNWDIPVIGGNLMRTDGIKPSHHKKIGFLNEGIILQTPRFGKIPKIGNGDMPSVLGMGKGKSVMPQIGDFLGPLPKIGGGLRKTKTKVKHAQRKR